MPEDLEDLGDGTVPVPNGDLIGRSIKTDRGEAIVLMTASYSSAYVVIQYAEKGGLSVRVASQVRRALQLGGFID